MTRYTLEQILSQENDESPWIAHNHESRDMREHNRRHDEVEAALAKGLITETEALAQLNGGHMINLLARDTEYSQDMGLESPDKLPSIQNATRLGHIHRPQSLENLRL